MLSLLISLSVLFTLMMAFCLVRLMQVSSDKSKDLYVDLEDSRVYVSDELVSVISEMQHPNSFDDTDISTIEQRTEQILSQLVELKDIYDRRCPQMVDHTYKGKRRFRP